MLQIHANTMENERFELENVAIPLKWQLPAPKCCKVQGKTEQQIPKRIPKRSKIIPQTIPNPLITEGISTIEEEQGIHRLKFWKFHLRDEAGSTIYINLSWIHMWLEIDTHISVFPEPTKLIVAILKPRKLSFVGAATLQGQIGQRSILCSFVGSSSCRSRPPLRFLQG